MNFDNTSVFTENIREQNLQLKKSLMLRVNYSQQLYIVLFGSDYESEIDSVQVSSDGSLFIAFHKPFVTLVNIMNPSVYPFINVWCG